MECCQSSCTGSYFVDAVIQVGYTVIDVINRFRVGRQLMIQSRYVLASRIVLPDKDSVLFDPCFVIDRTGIDGVRRSLFNRRVGYILDGRIFPQRNGLAFVTIIVDGVLRRSLQLVFRSGLTGRNVLGIPGLVSQSTNRAFIILVDGDLANGSGTCHFEVFCCDLISCCNRIDVQIFFQGNLIIRSFSFWGNIFN